MIKEDETQYCPICKAYKEVAQQHLADYFKKDKECKELKAHYEQQLKAMIDKLQHKVDIAKKALENFAKFDCSNCKICTEGENGERNFCEMCCKSEINTKAKNKLKEIENV